MMIFHNQKNQIKNQFKLIKYKNVKFVRKILNFYLIKKSNNGF